MWLQETSIQPKVDVRPPVLNGGWWLPFHRRVPIASDSMSVVTLAQQPATSSLRYESALSSDVVIWTVFN